MSIFNISFDYCFAVKSASAKLSELAVGIGPFVVGPAVQRKVGLSAFSQMAINATKFFDADWAREKGLYAEVFETTLFLVFFRNNDFKDTTCT